MNKFVIYALILCVALTIVLEYTVTYAEDYVFSIGVAMYKCDDEYYADIKKAFISYGTEQGYKIIVSDAENDSDKQIKQMEDFIFRGIDAIVVDCIDSDAIVDVINRAVEAGISVISFEHGANSDQISTYITFDYYQNGQMIGEWAVNYIKEQMGGNAKVAILDPPISLYSQEQMVESFKKCIFDLLEVDPVVYHNSDLSNFNLGALIENLMIAHPDVDIIYVGDLRTYNSDLKTVEALNSEVIVLCSGWSSEGLYMLEKDETTFKVMCANVPTFLVRDIVDAITDLYNIGRLPKEIHTNPILIDASTIADFDWRNITD